MKIGIPFVIIIVLNLTSSEAEAQIPIEYSWTKIKHEFTPLAPLDPAKTFKVRIPDSLKYVLGRNEVRKYWSPFGLQLVNKWDEKSQADYTIKLELDGLNVLQTQIEERESQRTVTGKEFFRHFLFSFPSRILIIDNETNETIRTVTVTTADDTFVRIQHRNLFITDSFDPNYKEEVGYDSLRTVKRLAETDVKVLSRLEGNFAQEVIFEKMKEALVALYGEDTFKGQFAAFNPKAKNRSDDFSDFDTYSQKMMKAYELLKLNWNDEEARKLLQEAEDFYVARSENREDRFKDYVPMMMFYNLAEINLIQSDYEKADLYFDKASISEKPDAYFNMNCEPAYMDAKKFLEIRHAVAQNKVFTSPQKAVLNVPVSGDGENTTISPGYLVLTTTPSDTLYGQFKDFDKAVDSHNVMFTDKQGKEKSYDWTGVKYASSEGIVYESMRGSLVTLVYHSPSIHVYQLRQTSEYIYSFPKTGAYGKYRAFTRDDAANYLVNYNKQLAELFKGCPDVAKKIESGVYDLKSEKANGHIKVIGDFETSCGSGSFEKNLNRFRPELVKMSYK